MSAPTMPIVTAVAQLPQPLENCLSLPHFSSTSVRLPYPATADAICCPLAFWASTYLLSKGDPSIRLVANSRRWGIEPRQSHQPLPIPRIGLTMARRRLATLMQ